MTLLRWSSYILLLHSMVVIQSSVILSRQDADDVPGSAGVAGHAAPPLTGNTLPTLQ